MANEVLVKEGEYGILIQKTVNTVDSTSLSDLKRDLALVEELRTKLINQINTAVSLGVKEKENPKSVLGTIVTDIIVKG